jgi:hypothetical protein
VFYLGNDSSDEKVYEFLKSEKVNTKYFSPGCAKFICTLENKPSEADYFIEAADQVSPLLEKLYITTKRKKKNRSYSDLIIHQNNSSPFRSIKNT